MRTKKKKEEEKNISKGTELQENVAIPVYAPNTSLRPRDYLLARTMSKLEENFEETCKDFLKNTQPDKYNGSYMDAIIQKAGEEAIISLTLQRAEHISILNDLLDKLWLGDKIKGQAKLDQAMNERKEVEKEIQKLQRIYWKGTSFLEEQEVSE